MNIGGFIPNSLIDYPGMVSCVVFTQGCNFHCPYCHNPDLVPLARTGDTLYSQDWFFSFLEERRGLLDAVVISGGEPTLQKHLPEFLRRIKSLGFRIKLDTNGSRPQVVRVLAAEKLVDYIAMDIKTDPWNYAPDLCRQSDPQALLASMAAIMEAPCDYEFRTTCVKPFTDSKTIRTIASCIRGAKRYVLQPFRPDNVLSPSFFSGENSRIGAEDILEFKRMVEPFVQECLIR